MLTARDRPTNFPTEESTLKEHQSDVIIACFGMGESFAGDEGLAEFQRDVDAFIKTHAGKVYNGKSQVRLILVSPIAYEDLGELTPQGERRNHQLASYTQAMGEVAGAATPVFFTATAMIGMIALSGIAVRNAILLIEFLRKALDDGLPLGEAILQAGAIRLRPIFLTAGTAMLAAIPITLDPIFSGLAWALIFGLLVSSLFTLILVPMVYAMIYGRRHAG